MKTFERLAILLYWCAVMAGCGDEAAPVNTENSVLKNQINALKQAKQMDKMLMQADAKHREMLEERVGDVR